MPANFKTYEAQARLLAALVAANPGIKLDFKAIAQHYGSDLSTSAVEHKFRPIKEQAKALRTLVKNGVDPKGYDVLEKSEIAKYFGESTPDGLQFQFRGVKANAEKLRDAVANGGNPATALNAPGGSAPGSATVTPAKPRGGGTAKRATPASGKTPRATPAKKVKQELKDMSDSEDEVVDYDELDPTPTKRRKNKLPQPALMNERVPRDGVFLPAIHGSVAPAATLLNAVPTPSYPPSRMSSVPSMPAATQDDTPSPDYSVQTPVAATGAAELLAPNLQHTSPGSQPAKIATEYGGLNYAVNSFKSAGDHYMGYQDDYQDGEV